MSSKLGSECLIISVPAKVDVEYGHFITVDGYVFTDSSPANKRPIGLSVHDALTGEGVAIAVVGIAIGIAGDTINQGDYVMPEAATGKVIPYAATAGNDYPLGIALDSGSENDEVRILLSHEQSIG